MGHEWATSGPWQFSSLNDDHKPNSAILQKMTLGLTGFPAVTNTILRAKSLYGAAGGDRTHDPWLRRPILYPLSYSRNSKKDRSSYFRTAPA